MDSTFKFTKSRNALLFTLLLNNGAVYAPSYSLPTYHRFRDMADYWSSFCCWQEVPLCNGPWN